MRWDRLFPVEILQRGQALFRRSGVRSFRYNVRTHNFSGAMMDGFRFVSASATIEKGNPVSWHCSECSKWNGAYSECPHLVALLYAIDSDVNLHPEHLNLGQIPESVPFRLESSGNSYFKMDKIAESVKVDPRYQSRAKQMYQNGEVLMTGFQLAYDHYDPQSRQTANVSFRLKNENESTMFADISPDSLKLFSCDHYGCQSVSDNERELCPHGQAALMVLRDYVAEYDPGDCTDQNAAGLMDSLRRIAVKSAGDNTVIVADEVRRTIRLEPRLEGTAERLLLSFKIGTDKLFVVKSLPDLVDCVDRKNTMVLGKSQILDFSADDFDEQGKQLFSFINAALGEQTARSDQLRRSSDYYVPQLKKIVQQIDLTGLQLDEFFDMFADRTVEYTNKDEGISGGSISFSEKAPDLSLLLETVRNPRIGEITGFALRGELPVIYRGARFSYMPVMNTLYRVSMECAEILKPLYGAADSQKLDLMIGTKNFPEFYHSLLPLLRKVFKIEEPSEADLEDLMPNCLQLTFYLDRENSLYTCRAETAYGDNIDTLKPPFLRTLDETRNIYADRSAEANAYQTISRYFPNYDDTRSLYTCPDKADNAFDLLSRGVNTLRELGTVKATEAFMRTRIRKSPKVSIGVSLKSDLLNLTVDANDMDREELLRLLDSYRAKKRWHQLENGDFVELDQSVGELADVSDALNLDPREFKDGMMQIPAYRSLYLDKLLENCENVYTHRDSNFRSLARNFKTVNDSDYDVPDSLEQLLRPYQVYGFKWMRTIADNGFGGILADDMGLGKTLQAITVLLSEKEAGTEGTSLVICPASLVFNWKEEIQRFAPALKVGMLNGQKTERETLLKSWKDYDVIITSYGILTRDIKLFEDITFLYEIIDEAQFIKTHTTTTSKAVRAIHAKHRFALTGTPIENRLSELWSIFDYLMPGYLYNYEKFRQTFETPIVRDKDTSCSERLRKMVSPFILRRLKSDVLKDLPEKMEEIRRAILEDEQKKLYDAQALRLRGMLEQTSDDDFSKNKIAILSELTRIRRICCDPSLVYDNYEGSSAKREAVMDLIKTAIEGGHRMLIFSQFTSMLDLLESDLNGADIRFYRLDGSTDKKKRVEMMHEFNDGDVPVFLISLKAGGTGLNLVGADIVIHYDPWWNPAVERQASDRVHRIGQTKAVTIYRLIAKDTIEERILQLQDAKKELADAILAGENGGITQFSREDLLALLDEQQSNSLQTIGYERSKQK